MESAVTQYNHRSCSRLNCPRIASALLLIRGLQHALYMMQWQAENGPEAGRERNEECDRRNR
jgi:hypothetical protein